MTGPTAAMTRRALEQAATIALASMLIVAVAACGQSPSNPSITRDPAATVGTVPPPTLSQSAAGSTTPVTTSPSFTPPAKLTAADIAAVKGILTESTQHFKSAFAEGKRVLGIKQYPNAFAGLDAMSDPTSNASRFSSWRTTTGIETDQSFGAAFTLADAYYTADNEPAGIGNWRIDMIDATSALNQWVQAAVSWQISEISGAALAAAEAKVTAAFKLVEADIVATVTGT